MDQAIGTFLTLFTADVAVAYTFQNFYIGESKTWEGDSYSFLPFGFSGVTVSREGDNVSAQTAFPNNELSRTWATTAVAEAWFLRAHTLKVDATGEPLQLISSYTGQITSASWDETALILKTSSVLDAVQPNIPNRRLNRNLVGSIPVTDAIRL